MTYLTNHATGAAYPAVNAKDFENAKVVQPAKMLLGRLDEVVGPMLDLREALIRKNRNLRHSRDLLLPKLISGEIDVEKLDIKVPAENGVAVAATV